MEKKHRSVAEISQEYTQVCAKAGDLQYRIYTLSKDLELANQTLKDLNFEAAASQSAEAEAAKSAEQATSEPQAEASSA